MGGKTYLASEITEAEGKVVVKSATEIGGSLTKAAITNHLTRTNIGQADTFTMQGMVSYQTRDLTTEEQFLVSTLIGQFELVKKTALPRVENDQFIDRVLANG
jgi:hypothetical protein